MHSRICILMHFFNSKYVKVTSTGENASSTFFIPSLPSCNESLWLAHHTINSISFPPLPPLPHNPPMPYSFCHSTSQNPSIALPLLQATSIPQLLTTRVPSGHPNTLFLSLLYILLQISYSKQFIKRLISNCFNA